MTADRPRVPGLLLRLAGPLQSWGEHSHFNDRDTLAFPSRSALTGLLAAALGRPRHQSLDDLEMTLTVRVDRPGNRLRDFHTVGGGLSGPRSVITADGGRRPGDTSTLTSTRWYLEDAAFTIALARPDHTPPPPAWANALRFPRWPLYLGRRSCPPAGPLLIGASSNLYADLVRLPLAQPAPATRQQPDDTGEEDTVEVLFLSDQPLTVLPAPAGDGAADDAVQVHSTVLDAPVDFTPGHRRYRARPLYRRTLPLPAALRAGYGPAHLRQLAAYTSPTFTPEARPAPEGSLR
ncbi:type I-E CRISPR-associated protein Cas5/CasD [Streptomyces sp. NPDC047000]|uniref:type I-E CRISPR-associated protein Cas5/CasD n=1 Tax=Streptomyces sp. NPDC047000 TaxID=3155474 RepID=UPI0033DBDD8D